MKQTQTQTTNIDLTKKLTPELLTEQLPFQVPTIKGTRAMARAGLHPASAKHETAVLRPRGPPGSSGENAKSTCFSSRTFQQVITPATFEVYKSLHFGDLLEGAGGFCVKRALKNKLLRTRFLMCS